METIETGGNEAATEWQKSVDWNERIESEAEAWINAHGVATATDTVRSNADATATVGQWESSAEETVRHIAAVHGTGSVAGDNVTVAAQGTGLQHETEQIGVLQNKEKENMGAMRDERGRLLPGARVPGAGRKSKAHEVAYLEALRSAIDPSNIKGYIETALRLAIEQNSSRGIIAVLSFAADYAIGKPTQRLEIETGRTELLQQLLESKEPLLPEIEVKQLDNNHMHPET